MIKDHCYCGNPIKASTQVYSEKLQTDYCSETCREQAEKVTKGYTIGCFLLCVMTIAMTWLFAQMVTVVNSGS